MKIILLHLIFTIIYYNAYSQPKYVVFLCEEGVIQKFKYEWGDEFDSNISGEKWMKEYPWGRSLICNNEQQIYLPENAVVEHSLLRLFVDNKKLLIRANPELSDSAVLVADCDYNGIPDTIGINLREINYSSGMLYSKPGFKYGLFECKFKIPNGKGLWPAFWLFGHQGEIDAFEIRCHQTNKIHFDLHQGISLAQNGPLGGEPVGGWIRTNIDFSNNFNNMSIIWKENTVEWFINNIPVAIEYHHFKHPMSVVLNLAVAGNCPSPFCPGPDDNTYFPAFFEIDYVRTFSPADSNEILLIQNINEKKIEFLDAFKTKSEKSLKATSKYLKQLPEFTAKNLEKPLVRIDFNENNQEIGIEPLDSRFERYEIKLLKKYGLSEVYLNSFTGSSKIMTDNLDAGEYKLIFNATSKTYEIPFTMIK